MDYAASDPIGWHGSDGEDTSALLSAEHNGEPSGVKHTSVAEALGEFEAGGIFATGQAVGRQGQDARRGLVRRQPLERTRASELSPPSVIYRPVDPRMAHGLGGGAATKVPSPDAGFTGVSLVLVPVGAYIGYRYGGYYGAGAGALGVGALLNLARASRLARAQDEASRNEALISATYAVLGGCIAGYLVYRAERARKEAES